MASQGEAEATREEDKLIVGIGASAGGLKALEIFFQQVEPSLGATYVVIQHLSPDFKSLMAELLARHTELPISPIEDGEEIEANRVYLIPPRKVLSLDKNHFILRDADRSPSLPVDVFFESLARRFGSNAVGIVLSGTGSDGMQGAKAIKKAGGHILVQDPDSAEFDGMPRSVILNGVFDEILRPEEMSHWLYYRKSRTPADSSSTLSPTMHSIGDSLRRVYGLDIECYKSSTVNRRIERRIDMIGEESIDSYSVRLARDSQELDLLYRDLLIGVSSFFRDPEVWDFITTTILPSLFRDANNQEFRAWVAGCATGEEVYTLCMLLAEQAETVGYKGSIHIFATDLHPGSLAIASEGVYPADALKNIPAYLKEKYFTRENSSFRASPTLRSKIVFASHNLIVDPPFTRLDIVTCRNLLIYLEPGAQKKAIAMLLFGLRKGGTLLLGASENSNSDELGIIATDPNLKVFEKVRQMPIADMPTAPSNHAARPFRQRWQKNKGITLDAQLLSDYDTILAKQVGDGFIIGEQHQVLQYVGDPNIYLKPLSGRASPSILSQLAGELHLALSTCLQRVSASKSSFTMHGVRYSIHEEEPLVDLRVDPLIHEGGENHYFVSIKKRAGNSVTNTPQIPEDNTADNEKYEPSEARSHRIAELELELQANRENLQAAIEQAQMSNEELQASNEELLASNEELQSTNEELHSVNEELFSVNSEFEQKNIELHGLNQDYDRLLSSLVNIGILYLDGELRIRKFNQAATSIFKLVKRDIGRPIEHIAYTLGNQAKFLRRVKKVIDEQIPVSFESKAPHNEYLMVRIFPHGDQGEMGDGAIITFTDISEVKLAQSRLETAVSASKIVWWDWDIEDDSFQTYCHDERGFNCILGYTRSNIPKTAKGWLEATHPDDVKAVENSLQAHLSGQTNHWSSEHRYKDPGGDWVWVRDSGEVVQRGPNGEAIKMVGTTQNIDERKKLEQLLLANDEENKKLLVQAKRDSSELKKLAEEAEKASIAKSQFLAMMSHEIRTPLNAIIGYSDLLLNLQLEEEVRENLQPIAIAGQNLLGIIGDILDFSKLESDALRLEERPFALQDIIQSTQSSIPQKKGVTLSCQLIDSSLRPFKKSLWLRGDPIRLSQVLVNLIGNSVKFTEEGEVSLIAQIRAINKQSAALSFTVRDEGIGIDPKDMDTIFEPFMQSDNSIARQHNGTGLGLSICKRLVDAMGSSIQVESELGEGSVFSFELSLPIYDTNSIEKLEELPNPTRKESPRALIIEDHRDNGKLLAKMLLSLGVESDTANNGQQGIEMLYQKDYDIAFMDLSMPKLDGISATRAIRSISDERFKDLTIIALTANATIESRKLCDEVGMDDFISKPATLSKIKSVIESYFELGKLT